ncbi:MAG: hypothetical protein ACE5JU_16490 [Candidatus Binatia bacterium]
MEGLYCPLEAGFLITEISANHRRKRGSAPVNQKIGVPLWGNTIIDDGLRLVFHIGLKYYSPCDHIRSPWTDGNDATLLYLPASRVQFYPYAGFLRRP